MGDDVVVIMERMTTTTTTTTTTTKKDEEKETKITVCSITKEELSSSTDAERKKVVITEVEAVTKLFLGYSLWCAAYSIVYTVAMIAFCDGNKKVSAIVSMIPVLLVSCLLLRWTHAYAVKLIDSYLINPAAGPSELIPENRRSEFEGNLTLRYACSGLCFFVDAIIIGVKGLAQQREFVTVVLGLGLLFLYFVHYNWIRVYLNKNLIIMQGLPNHHPKDQETTNNNNNIDIGSTSM